MFHTDKTWVLDQSERAKGPIYILMWNNLTERNNVLQNIKLLRAESQIRNSNWNLCGTVQGVMHK